ncbi:MAG TPA: glycosyltransferase family 2 protein, partial [Burkholderiaceae bacterium]
MTRVPSTTHVVVIPSYDTGPKVYETVAGARAQWQPVFVVVDGSRDGTTDGLQQMAAADPGLRVWVLPHNQGKGAAVLRGIEEARAAGFTHALTMDADGQHPEWHIRDFMEASRANPDAQILGVPVFDATAPRERVHA